MLQMKPTKRKLEVDTVLLAYTAFKQPNKMRLAYMIPKDKAAWLEYLVYLVRKKTVIKYLSDKELKKVILRAKPNLVKKYPPFIKDPDVPDSVYWTQEQVASWVEEIGYPHMKDAFLDNFIDGRKLVYVDASALNQMGLQDFKQIKNLATQIREILQVHRPNILRAIARQVPFHQFLKIHAKTGLSYDGLTFEKFCEDNGYPYEVLRRNKSALISCTCTVIITPSSLEEESENSSEGSEISSDNMSLENAPSVEFLVRRKIVRDRAIQKIIDEVLSRVFDPAIQRKYGYYDMHEILKRILEEAYLDLGFGNPEIYTFERVTFAASVAEGLMKDMLRSVEVLNDIKRFEEHLKKESQKEDYKPEEIEMIRDVANEFVEHVAPIAAMLALGQFSLESIFSDEPEFQEYVQSVIDEAENKTNELVPTAEEFINEIVTEAEAKVEVEARKPSI